MEFFCTPFGSSQLLKQDTPSPRRPGVQSLVQLQISSAVGGLEEEKDSDGKEEREGRGGGGSWLQEGGVGKENESGGRQKHWREIKLPAAGVCYQSDCCFSAARRPFAGYTGLGKKRI